jgi:polysaccharide pyruvyl transferase WcaK-like protein
MMAAWTMRHAEAVFARDATSLEAAKKLAPEAKNRLAVDVAFALPFTPAEKGPGTRVGINVSGLLYSGGYAGGNQYGLTIDYKDFTHRLVETLLARPGVSVELISHATSPNLPSDDDAAAVAKVAAAFPGARAIPPFASPSEAKSYISGLDFLVAARMHATIAAYSTGVPVVPISYSRKFEGLYGSLSYPWLVPAKGMTTEEALRFTLDAFDRRSELTADISLGKAQISNGLEAYVSALAELFSSIAAGRT